jgi:two-component system cell cycle sensor histidine kinase/response regulator CckA
MVRSNDHIKKILVVDDDDSDFLLFQSKLKKLALADDYEITHIENYDHGLDSVLLDNHDLYFIDYALGHHSGLDLIENAVAKGHSGPFIMLTGMDRPDLYKRSSETGAYDYILKDEVSTSQLERAITYALERKDIEDRLKSEKEFSAQIVREVPYMVIGLDGNGCIKDTNPEVSQVTGYQSCDLMGMDWLTLIPKTDLEIITDAIQSDQLEPFQTSLKCHDESVKIIEWAILVKTKNDNGMSIIGKDLTSQLQKEKQKNQQEKMQALGHLAGGVAHEINNLLQPILFNAEWAIECDTKQGRQNALNDIIANTKIASSIVEDILIFSRGGSEHVKPVNFLETFEQALRVSREMTPKGTTINVTNNLEDKSAHSILHLKDLVRALSNLVQNACHAMTNKGVIDITIDQVPHSHGSHIQITVTDTGCGIPEDKIDKILNLFFTTKEIGEGTGLGLPIFYNLVHNWGGDITIDSTENKGTSVGFSIPMHTVQ